MNLESSFHGLPDWHFPSPSSTPRSSAFEQAPFQTPKCEPSSHFLDAFYTPRITGHQTPAATPVEPRNEIAARTPASSNTSPLTPQDPNFHVNHYKGGHLPLPPVDASRRLSSTSDALQAVDRSTILKAQAQSSMDGFNLQTPPPTRETSTRRQYGHGHPELAHTPQHVYPPGTMQTPIRHDVQNYQQNVQFHTPVQLTQLQYSPAMFQYPNGVPQSAPAVANQRFSWNTQSPSFSFANEAMMSSQQDVFGPPHLMSPGFAQWQTPDMSAPPPQQDMSASFGRPLQAADFWTTPAISAQPTPSINETSSFASTITTTGVDPSMIFSFTSLPSREMNTSPIRPHITPQKLDTGLRQPYEHQMRESTREKELAKKTRETQARASNTGSASISFGRLALQRSNTDSGPRRPRSMYVENNRTAQILEQVERRPSPLKRHSQLSLTAIPEAVRPRPKTRLVVGEDGRARTETVDAPTDSPIQHRHGFEIWDESSSEEEMTSNSRRDSYGPQRISSKHGRTGSDHDHFDPNKRPLSSASVSSLASRLENTPIGKRASRDMNYRRFSSGSYAASVSTSHVSPTKDEEMMDDGPDAQAALKKMMSSRSGRRDAHNPQAILDAHNQRWSQSVDVARFNTMQEQTNNFDPFASAGSTSLSPTSGTDPDILTPSTEHSTRSNESTRCVCNMSDVPDQMMVQCESCTKWLHVKCIGLPLDPRQLPPVYVCVFCTGTTPLARGGRIREPTRRTEPSHASPLGYKSGGSFFRR